MNGNQDCYLVDYALSKLAFAFEKKYFTYDDGSKIDTYCIDGNPGELKYNRQCGDYHFSMQDIYYAMWYDIPKEILFEWYDVREKEKINLKNFYKLRTNNGKTNRTT